MDEKYVEMAGALAEGEVEAGRGQCAKQAFPSQDLTPDQYKTTECLECEEPLPTFRMKKGFTLCVPCQNVKERARKR